MLDAMTAWSCRPAKESAGHGRTRESGIKMKEGPVGRSRAGCRSQAGVFLLGALAVYVCRFGETAASGKYCR